MTGFNIDTFAAELGRRGAAKSSHFYVVVSVPSTLRMNRTGTDSVALTNARTESLALRIEQVNIPGRGLMTQLQRYGNGPAREIPYGSIYFPMTATVILSEDMFERQLFLQWQDLFAGNSRTGRAGSAKTGAFDVGYYDDCVGQIDVLQFAESPIMQGSGQSSGGVLGTIKDAAETIGFDTSIITRPYGFDLFGSAKRNIVHATKTSLMEVYPRTVTDVTMSWADDGHARLNIELMYRYYVEEHSSTEAKRFAAAQDDKSALRRTVESLQRFIPVAGAIRNLGLGGAVRATGEQYGGGARNVLSTNRRVLPF